MLSLLLTVLLPQSPSPAPGIARELATARAQLVADVRYDLEFALAAPIDIVRGRAAITFTLKELPANDAPLVLDFDAKELGELRINGAAAEAAMVAGHLLLPPKALRAGANTVAMTFASAVAPTGTPLCVYRDAADGKEYCYTLLVPADAHRLFPCFDQPDVKARFSLQLELPAEWTAIGNGDATSGEAKDDRRRWRFAESKPLPTYLFAFAAGPWAVVEAASPRAPGMRGEPPLRVLLRESQRRHLDLPALERLHGDGLRWLCDYFAVDYPFDKLDIALVPGFPYGGMEHAGAIFYREQSLVFDHAPTDGELVRRSTLVYHELSHQWFGNLVTMRWFDDLWLKEGFATFVAYRAMDALEPERRSWLRFLQRVKPRAYEVDATPGTTPVYQELANLADAKSAYGAIVYNKAPAVLRELDERLGSERFRKGLTRFLRDHSFGNATWQDLAKALEDEAKIDLRRWSDRWLLAPSLPSVRVECERASDGGIARAVLRQKPVDGDGTWPLRVELCCALGDGSWLRTVVDCDGAETPIPELKGRKDVRAIVANPGDVAYAQFLPDEASRDWLAAHAHECADPLLRAVMVATLFESVREAEFAPGAMTDVLLRLVRNELDADSHAWLIDLAATCIGRYVDEPDVAPRRAQFTAVLLEQLRAGEGAGRRLPTFRWLARNGSGDDVQRLCEAAVGGLELPAGLKLGREDRFLALAHLLGSDKVPDAQKDTLCQQVTDQFRGEDVGRDLFLARAARGTEANKAEYFALYLQPDQPPEQWSQDSLGNFHWRGQSKLTLPFLRRALDQAQWVKAHRRIFFMPAWLDGFVNGHSSAAALAIVDDFLATATIDADVKKKLLQSRDGLARAVRIRAAFGKPR